MNKTALFLSLALIFGITACDTQTSNTPNTETTISTQQTDTRQPESVVYTMKNYDEISSFKDGVAQVQKGDKYGLIDSTGKEIVSPQYDFMADEFHEGLVFVRQG